MQKLDQFLGFFRKHDFYIIYSNKIFKTASEMGQKEEGTDREGYEAGHKFEIFGYTVSEEKH